MAAIAPVPTAQATLRYLRGSPQKVRLVVDELRGRSVTEALSILKVANKVLAHDLAKVLKSAVANAEQKEVGNMEELMVAEAYVNGGPSLKRIRPAPMGRAYRYLHRTSHVTFRLRNAGGADRTKGRAAKAKGKAAEAPKGKPRKAKST